ncbi:MAG: hypothetical protein ACTSWM_02135 [Alphaproteobacteria bacterium]
MPADVEFVNAYDLPRCIPLGRSWPARLDILRQDGTPETLSGPGTYALFYGSELAYSTSAITFGAGFAELTASVGATELDGKDPADHLLERWTVNTTEPGVRTFTRPAALVRYPLSAVITDADLTALHSDLTDLRDPDQASFEAQRNDAWTSLNKWLIQRGNRPRLIMDDWMLRDVHRYLSLECIFRDFASSVGDGRYRELADFYRLKASEEFDNLVFSYDFDGDGRVSADEHMAKAARPVTTLMQPWGWNA